MNTVEKRQEEKNEIGDKINKAKAELIKQEYQENLKENLEQRLFDLIHKIRHKDKGLSTIQINSYIRKKTAIGIAPKYSNEELLILFQYYQEFIEKINEVTLYIPTQKNFCSFAGISTRTYNDYIESDDPEKKEIMKRIDDYISDIQLTEAQYKKIDNVTTIFRNKTEHKMVEAQPTIVIEHKRDTINTADILAQVEALKKGGSLIELKKDEDGIYKKEERTNEPD